jgi:hypothetical protein
MPAPHDPLAEFIACLLAIIDGLCRALAEQAAGDAGLDMGTRLRARCLTRLSRHLRRMAGEIAATAPNQAGATRAPPPSGAARAASHRPQRPAGGWRAARIGRGCPAPILPLDPPPLLFAPAR